MKKEYYYFNLRKKIKYRATCKLQIKNEADKKNFFLNRDGTIKMINKKNRNKFHVCKKKFIKVGIKGGNLENFSLSKDLKFI